MMSPGVQVSDLTPGIIVRHHQTGEDGMVLPASGSQKRPDIFGQSVLVVTGAFNQARPRRCVLWSISDLAAVIDGQSRLLSRADLRPGMEVRNLASGKVGTLLPDPKRPDRLASADREFVQVLTFTSSAQRRVTCWNLYNLETV